jgi:hypothetical protein
MISKETLEKHENYSNTNKRYREIEIALWLAIHSTVYSNDCEIIKKKLSYFSTDNSVNDRGLLMMIMSDISELLGIS